MTARLTIELDDSVLDALQQTGAITVCLVSAGPAPSGGPAGPAPREGSLPKRILEWAADDGEPFDTADVVGAFGVTRAHASMLLSTLAKGPQPLTRVKRGVYQYQG